MNGAQVDIVGIGTILPDMPLQLRTLPPEFGGHSYCAYQCDAAMLKSLIPAARLRRLGRAQAMALGAAMLAAKDAGLELPLSVNTAVMVGTGLGEQEETGEFLRQMILSGGEELRPAKFINSVHNSVASNVAIVFEARAENYTFTHNAISFELALGGAMRAIESNRADAVLACGIDLLTPFVIAAGLQHRWRRNANEACNPMAPSTTAAQSTIPGEGAAAFLLARPGVFPADKRACRLTMAETAVLDRPVAETTGEPEADLLCQWLSDASVDISDVSFVLFGANGDARNDAAHQRVLSAIECKSGRALPYGVYKNMCGEFCTASAIGLALGADALSCGRLPESVLCRRQPDPAAKFKHMLVCSLSAPNYLSCVLVSV